NAFDPAQRHGDIELARENVDGCGHPCLAARTEAIDVGSAHHAGACPAGERAHHVLAGTDAAVEHHLDYVADRIHHLRQCRDRGGRAVELTPTVIGDHERAGPCLGGSSGILDVENAFENELARPQAAYPLDILPVQCRIELA